MSVNTPTAANITATTADLSAVAATGLSGPITYQYRRWQGASAFTPETVVVTPDDGSDGAFSPSSVTFHQNGTAAPAAQTVQYTPNSRGTKSINFANTRGLTNPSPLSFVVSAYVAPGTSYSTPDTVRVLRWTGINKDILNETDGELAEALGEFLTLAEAETALEVTEVKFAATNLSQAQIIVLQQSVAYHAVGNFLICPTVRVLTGTQEPLLMQGGDTLDDIARLMHSRATELSVLFATGDVSQIQTRMAINATRALR